MHLSHVIWKFKIYNSHMKVDISILKLQTEIVSFE